MSVNIGMERQCTAMVKMALHPTWFMSMVMQSLYVKEDCMHFNLKYYFISHPLCSITEI